MKKIRTKTRVIIAAAAAVLCQAAAAGLLHGYSYRNSFLQLGDDVLGLTAASAGKSGAGAAELGVPSAIFANPAGIFAPRGLVSLTFGTVSTSERRVHNDTDSTTVSNENSFFEMPFAAASYPVITDKLSLAAGRAVLSDFNFAYKENIHSATQIVGRNKVESEGVVQALGAAVSYNPAPSVILGVSAYGISGSPEQEISSTTFGTLASNKDQVVGSISTSTSHSFSGSFLTLGGAYHLGGKTIVALAYRPSAEISDGTKIKVSKYGLADVSTDADYKFKYPESVTLGFSFRFPGPSEPTFYLDFVRTDWSGAKVKADSSGWKDCGWTDTLSWRVGAEHLVKNKKFRYGLAYLPDYSRKSSDKMEVSCGLGFNVWIIEIDASAQYFMRRNTLEDRLFPVPEDADLPRINLETIDDYAKRFLLSGKIKW